MNGTTDPRERRIYFDTCVYIRLIQPTDGALAQAVDAVVSRAGFHGTRIVTSELTVAEILIEPIESALRSQDHSAYETYDSGIFSSQSTFQEMVPVSREVLTLSAHLRAELRYEHKLNVKLPDAIHLASAILGRCDTIVTGDGRMLDAARVIRPRSIGLSPKNVVPLAVEALLALQSELPLP